MATQPTPTQQPASNLKVLRIGLVQDDKLVQQRLIRAGESVTVGESVKNTLSFAGPTLPKRFPMFVAKGNRYTLQITEGMDGRIALGDAAAQTVAELKSSGAAARRGGTWQLPLHESHRGKISVDGVTILFQFVPAPPEPLQPRGNLDFRPRLIDQSDPVFLAFLGLFTALATLMMIYVYTAPPREPTTFFQLPDRFVNLVVDVPPPEIDEPVNELGDPTKVQKVQKVQKVDEAVGEKDSKAAPKDSKVAEAEERQKVSKAVEEQSALLQALMIGTRGSNNNNSRTPDLFDSSDAFGQDLDRALQDVGGVGVADSEDDLVARKGGGGTREDVGIDGLKKVGGGTGGVGTGPVTEVKGKVKAEAPEITGEGDAGTVKAVVSKYSGQVKYCYEAELKENPELQGRVEVAWTVSGGRATGVEILSNTTGNSALGSCIVKKVGGWKFSEELDMDVVYPFVLSR